MDLNRPRDLVAFAVVMGLIFYLANAVWSAVVLVPVPQDRDWCRGTMELSSGEQCVDFKNTFEEVKYRHNRRQAETNRASVIGQVFAGGFVGWLCFRWIPKRRGVLTNPRESFAPSVFFGMMVAIIAPLLLSWMLPAPVRWFPKAIVDYADRRVQQELDFLRGSARAIDAEQGR